MLSGTTPFAGTDEAIMYKIVYEPHKPLHKVMNDTALEPFDAVLDRALAKDPAQRYPSAMAMRTALMALATEPLPDVLPADIVLAPQHEGLEAKPPVAKERESYPSGPDSRSVPSPRSSASISPTPSKSAPGTGPSSVPVPTGWDNAALAEVERELAQHVGPVARVLVRRAARGLTSLAAVRQAVASSIVDFEARERFLAKAGGPRTDTAVSAAATKFQATQVDGEAPSGVPMREGDVDKAAAALLSSLGPIARVVAKRCAAKSDTREQFVARVLDQLTPSIDARRVQADLWRALG
jgi:eukaryotic-like serine/threonine-protein kinase